MTFRPKYVTFDCYGTLTNFDMAGAARRVYGAQLSEPAMSAFIKHFAAYRLDEVLGNWKPYAEVVHNAVLRACKLYGVSFFRDRSAGFFSPSERQVIRSLADTLISCVAKHNDVLVHDASLCALFASVEELASSFAGIPARLTARECEVCARIVYGMSMKEIARDLDISAESGITYRKRAYLRLRVTSRSELLRRLLEHL